VAGPSSLHGVTTVIGGNCGFTVAPIGEADVDYVARMLARVEGMSLEALNAGLSWDWSSFGEWLDRFEGSIALNAGFLVGHSTLRRAVMGDDAVGGVADEGQIAAMRRLLGESLAAGGLGLSSSWTPAHSDGDGRPVPSRSATADELVTLASVVRDVPGTLLEFVPGLAGFDDAGFDAMVAMSLAGERPINWNVIRVVNPDRGAFAQLLDAADNAATRGARIVALTNPVLPRILTSFANGVVLDNLPGSWQQLFQLPHRERRRAMTEPAMRAALFADASNLDSPWMLRTVTRWEGLEVAETFAPENAKAAGRTLRDIASERGASPFDAMLDIAVLDDLRTYFALPAQGDDDRTWAVRMEVVRDPRTIVGASDAGAHLDVMCGAQYTTGLLAEAVRDRNLLTVEEAIHHLTDAPARSYGLRGRGRLAAGYAADIVCFDLEKVGPGTVRTVHDLPGGAARLDAHPTGVHRVLVNGVDILVEGQPTGATPGAVLRSGRDTDTVTP
jgi:N-acyl-D-aspartate/D-glutamate deacylase